MNRKVNKKEIGDNIGTQLLSTAWTKDNLKRQAIEHEKPPIGRFFIFILGALSASAFNIFGPS